MNEKEIEFVVPSLSSHSISESIVRDSCHVAATQKISRGIYFLQSDKAVAAPTTLIPSPVPRYWFYTLKKLQKEFNELYHNLAFDSQFLHQSLKTCLCSDSLCRKLMNILEKRIQLEHGKGSRSVHKCQLGVFRADYMFERCNGSSPTCVKDWKARQIEVNTISSSFPGLSPDVAELHKSVLGSLSKSVFLNTCSSSSKSSPPTSNEAQTQTQTVAVPRSNSCLSDISNGFIEAYNYYCSCISPSNSSSTIVNNPTVMRKCIVFVVSANEANVIDQLKIENEITNSSGILVYRKTFEQLGNEEECWAEADGRFLIECGRVEVALFYYRTGYNESCYHNHQDWVVREKMDLSLAINCPSVRYQLAGMKKLQHSLSKSNNVERFLTEGSGQSVESKEIRANQIRSTFAQFYSFDDNDNDNEVSQNGEVKTQTVQDVVELALKNPSKFVLKPQREGGGNNYFDSEMVKKLDEIRHTNELNSFILMERVYPVTTENIIACCNYDMKNEDVTWSKVVGEFGVYGLVLSDVEGNIIINRDMGHLLRSKHVEKLDGGVVAGNACLDSPFLVE